MLLSQCVQEELVAPLIGVSQESLQGRKDSYDFSGKL